MTKPKEDEQPKNPLHKVGTGTVPSPPFESIRGYRNSEWTISVPARKEGE